jgi:hypothetical protein
VGSLAYGAGRQEDGHPDMTTAMLSRSGRAAYSWSPRDATAPPIAAAIEAANVRHARLRPRPERGRPACPGEEPAVRAHETATLTQQMIRIARSTRAVSGV